jgi:hypothetical protein
MCCTAVHVAYTDVIVIVIRISIFVQSAVNEKFLDLSTLQYYKVGDGSEVMAAVSMELAGVSTLEFEQTFIY